MTAAVVTPIETLTLLVGASQIECQVTGISLEWADPAGGDLIRNACGESTTIPADNAEVATLALTIFDDRTLLTGFSMWSRMEANRGQSADFTLVVNPAPHTLPYQYTGKLTVAAVPDKQDAFDKIETVDVSFPVTEISDPSAVTLVA